MLVSFVAVFAAASSGMVQADVASYYVGIDGRTTPFVAPTADGGGAYPNNPNLNRLTLLLHHGDHFHSIGAYSFSGPAAQPTLNDTNTNNRLPESFTGLPPLSLLRASGSGWEGTYRSGLSSVMHQDHEYGDLEIRNVQSLLVDDPITFNSSSGRWNKTFDAAEVMLELVSISEGLKLADSATPHQPLAVGDQWALGGGDELFRALPVFWVDGASALGSRYYAELRLSDRSGAYGDSGRFFIDFEVVPEPASWLLLLVSLSLVFLRRPT